MTDPLVEQLRARLQDVAETAPLELEPPLDLERRVQSARRKSKTRGLLVGLSVAAALVIALGTIALVGRSPSEKGVSVQVPGSRVTDAVFAGVVMLDARGPYVVALDAGGHQRATLVTVKRGNVIDAQLTADHQTIWYLSVSGQAGVDCGEVVRADVRTGSSHIVARAAAFAVSPDGARLALAGSCVQGVKAIDLATKAQTVLATAPADRYDQMRWSPDGRTIVTRTCDLACGPLVAYDAAGPATPRVVDQSGIAGEFGPNGLYVLRRDAVTVNGTTVLSIDASWKVSEVVPTEAGTFVVAAPPSAPRALYRVENGRLVHVRTFDYGTITPVP